MMSKNFIEIEMQSHAKGGGSFSCSADFVLDNVKIHFRRIPVKIDTGCAISTIPLRRLTKSPWECYLLKRNDIVNNVPAIRSYGVETAGSKHEKVETYRQKMHCKALKI
ncbi:hypothetical protein [Pseudobutyrivibrio xylanivorans]|uniref:Uncharacterized protein n=1 Tax=Pseudobutyrivibrio xylanivorans TaxID=185007 RepID=A0A5P6VUP0_PSEXY|nr:hypothetical protein [Pseudobutyrivibrio xylanivorans]QFJ56327.1 hypothetical protein FXF36_15530 [Pseudobutyrivibrio xylanivorans]